MNELIKNIIKPENEVEHEIICNIDFIEGVLCGKIRNGHPEGQIIYHIKEVLENVDKYANTYDRRYLRLIAILHDSFKHKVNQSKPKVGENHHGMIARRFAEKYIKNDDVLLLIELHDEAYNAWSIGKKKNDWNKANNLIDILDENNLIELYLIFYRCDCETGNKSQECYEWFCELTHN